MGGRGDLGVGGGSFLAGLAVKFSPFCYVTSGLVNLGFYGLSLLLMRCHCRRVLESGCPSSTRVTGDFVSL